MFADRAFFISAMTAPTRFDGAAGAFFMTARNASGINTDRTHSRRRDWSMVVQNPKSRVRSRLTPSKSTLDHEDRTNTADLQEELREALRATGYFIQLQGKITVDVSQEGCVVLRGTVPSYYHKQRAQVAVMSVKGVRSLQNDLAVKSSTEKPSHLGGN
jgi:osmotically-inducible protein OsmY